MSVKIRALPPAVTTQSVTLGGAIVVSALCAMHACAGMVRAVQLGRKQQVLERGDSVYGGPGGRRMAMDLILLLLVFLVALGLGLNHHKHRSVVPAFMIVLLGLLFSIKPARLLMESLWQLGPVFLRARMKVGESLQRVQSRIFRRGSENGEGTGEDTEDDNDVFDENDLTAVTRPELLAAEVMRLRRKVVELEEKLDLPPRGS
jgi:hypothetical protein